MSKVINNPFLLGLQGMFGNAMVVKMVRGKYQLANRPSTSRNKTSTPDQDAVKARFLKATQYAKVHAKLAKDKKPTDYTEGITANKHSVYLVAMSDFLNPPEIQGIEAPDYSGAIGETIQVSATDDFRVMGVKVTITDGNGARLESGDAVIEDEQTPYLWTYKTTVANSAVAGTVIRAVAIDKAKNKTTFEKEI
jgi:hypothetical protein